MHYRRLRVRLETEQHVVEGTLQLPLEGYRSRLTDFFCAHASDFVPVTDAELTWLDGSRGLERHGYLAVSVRHILLGIELESLGTFDEAGETPSGQPVFIASTPPPEG